MFIPMLVIVLCAVGYLAWLGLGDADPQDVSGPDFNSAMDEMEDDPMDEEPAPEPAPAVDKPADGDPPKTVEGDADKTANWSKDMTDFLQHIPDELKQKFQNRVEQGGRWGKGAPDGDPELQTNYDALMDAAKGMAVWLADGEEQLKALGPVEFLNQLKGVDPAIFAPKPEETPTDADEDLTPVEREIKELKEWKAAQENEKLAAAEAAKAQAASEKATEDFYKEYTPAYDKALESIKVGDADKKSVAAAFDQIAKGLFIMKANDAPGTATAAGAVEEALKAFDTINSAILKAGPQPPAGKPLVGDPNAVVKPLAEEGYQGAMDGFMDNDDWNAKE